MNNGIIDSMTLEEARTLLALLYTGKSYIDGTAGELKPRELYIYSREIVNRHFTNETTVKDQMEGLVVKRQNEYIEEVFNNLIYEDYKIY